MCAEDLREQGHNMKTVQLEERAQVLESARNRKMAASVESFVRGSTDQFYQWLQTSDARALPQGPNVWICGDCHVGNLGPVASKSGKLAIQVRDFDQTVIGNPAHDLIRLALSLAMAARSSDLPGVTTALMLERIMDGYGNAFSPMMDDAAFEDAAIVPDTVKLIMHEANHNSWKHLADGQVDGDKAALPLGARFWPLTPDERGAIDALICAEEVRRLATCLRSRDNDAEVRLLDAAYWRKGCSSLGRLRIAALVSVDKGKHKQHCLLDIKEAGTPSAPHAVDVVMPPNEAERVVAGGRELSPFLGARMLATALLGKSVFVRELLPQDLKLEIRSLTRDEALNIAEYLAHIVGLAHARQMTAIDRHTWPAELRRHRPRSLESPFWLWNALVELVGVHEAAYLKHCRRHALEETAKAATK
jgi:uncharacterized protein (DUF2252 family)